MADTSLNLQRHALVEAYEHQEVDDAVKKVLDFQAIFERIVTASLVVLKLSRFKSFSAEKEEVSSGKNTAMSRAR